MLATLSLFTLCFPKKTYKSITAIKRRRNNHFTAISIYWEHEATRPLVSSYGSLKNWRLIGFPTTLGNRMWRISLLIVLSSIGIGEVYYEVLHKDFLI